MSIIENGASSRLAVDLSLEGVSVHYGAVSALRDATLTLPPGTFVAVTGPSGAGKTTLLWAMAGAVDLASGAVRVGDEKVEDRDRAAARGIVIVPEGNGLAAVLTAHENVVVPLLASGVPPVEAAQRARRSLAEVGLEDSAHHLIEELSGGQQQRTAVARGLAARATVLLADEPTSDLDNANRERVIALLRAEAEAGAAVVMTTHDPAAAAQADAEYALDEGRLSRVR